MASLALSQKLNASADDVWALVGGFGGVAEFHAATSGCDLEEGGSVRRLHIADSPGQLVERLLHFDDAARTYSYTIIDVVDFAVPFTNYHSTIQVVPDADGGCTVTWEGSGEPVGDHTDEDCQNFWRFIYETGFKGLVEKFGAA